MAKVVIIGGFAESLTRFRGAMISEMVQVGHEVMACAPDIDSETGTALERLGATWRSVPIDRTGCNPVADLYTLSTLTRLLAAEKPDVVLCYTIKPVIYGSIAASRADVPSIFSMITGVGYAFAGRSTKARFVRMIVVQLYRAALAKNQCIFFQNPDDRRFFGKHRLFSGESVEINGSGVDINEYSYSRAPQTVSFLMIARLIAEKGVREYAEAAKRIHEEYPDVECRLVGWIDDAPTAIAEAELAEWQRDGAIHYLGKLEEVRPVIHNAAVYILPSYSEGTPRTVLEAMAMGRPIITTDVPGCRETVIHGQNGFLVAPRDVDSLVAAMKQFVASPNLMEGMGKESRRLAVEKYDVRKVNRVILKTMGLLT